MNKLAYTLLVLLFGFTFHAKAQLPSPPPATGAVPQQSVFLELGGNGLVYSLNYDVLFQSNWGFRLGGAFYPADYTDDPFRSSAIESHAFFGVVMGTRAVGQSAHKLEMGAGLLFGTIYDPQQWNYIEPPGATFTLGYRFYPLKPSRFTFKVAFTPTVTGSGFYPGIGISVGITLTAEGDASIR